MLSLAEEYVDSRSNWAGGQALRYEVRDGLTSDGTLLVIQGKDDLSDVLGLPDWGIGGEGGVHVSAPLQLSQDWFQQEGDLTPWGV